MICYEPIEAATLPSIRILLEGKSAVWNFQGGEETSGGLGVFSGPNPDLASFVESKPVVMDLPEEFDWTSKRVSREFVELEQKTLAGVATSEENKRYRAMRLNRNKIVFADRYVQDYAEVQRLKILSEKLLDLQKYLRPIRVS
jgi:hypothetical protein